MKIQAVLFDLDGTLIDTIPDLAFGLNQMLRKFGKEPLSVDQVSSMVGRGALDLMERVFKARGIATNEKNLKTAVNQYCDIMVHNGCSHSAVFPGVFDSLTKLKSLGIKTAIVTNKPRSMTDAVVSEKGLLQFVDCVVAAGDVPSVKPQPEMLWFACEKLGVLPQQAVMVGDSSNDALAAKNAGMQVCLVTTGYNGEMSISQWANENGFPNVFDSITAVSEFVLNLQAD